MSESDKRRRLFGVNRLWRNKIRLIKRKSNTLFALVGSGDWQGISERLRRNVKFLGIGREAALGREFRRLEPGVDILCTPHARYVANLIARSLTTRGITPISINDAMPRHYSQRLHIVICPQMFGSLPACYIAFQMEQTVSSRWFDQAYFEKLDRALAVMDYSKRNIEFLQNDAGFSYRRIFYTPISNMPVERPLCKARAPDDLEYDVVFYGDANSPRRQRFLDALRAKYRVLCVSEEFGEVLYERLLRASLVVNIHYYEGALLETTRIYECLSLGLDIVSESSVDIEEHESLMPWVTFTPIGDIEEMVRVVGQRLAKVKQRTATSIPDDLANFDYYFIRMLVALDVVSADFLNDLPAPISPSQLTRGVGLSLPETPERHALFREEFPSFSIFPGLRHMDGWRGCGLSYRYLTRLALREGIETLEVREDDALLDADSERRWAKACKVFDAAPSYGVLSGLLAEIADDVEIQEMFEEDGECYVVINRLMSMVCNRYAVSTMRLMAEWDFEDKNAERNTIDRYLARHDIKVLVPLPFIARHRPDAHSTLWSFQNTTYDELIANSEKRLTALARDFSQIKSL